MCLVWKCYEKYHEKKKKKKVFVVWFLLTETVKVRAIQTRAMDIVAITYLFINFNILDLETELI